ncbi:hypothetical protein N5P37_005457 [Trichoderma harzianum]|uniref:Uncharacterized protein n=1 Tax=Trichoderma harzianum CBS 226.95 TaxID=983964 RepID=A0A2T4ABV6_TRIHA|nr:hypothetical protein M431DRAFT_5224 [Trichoderma harzianum CBS 226.95]KAK0762639.1 hypothetical protein N5P37_005457 [Trichoderma harzianum]PKK42001.1 hypothetical protein CI102_12882 [Trichoderma harzianum]PTB54561.1 hypothetical protein M431DRAFT_5224 [Trichoderma harzianum CBS 226.95]
MRQEQDRRARLRARYAALPAQALGSSRQRHHEPDAMGIDDPSWIEQRLQERMWREFPVPPEPNQRPRQNGINGINGNQRPRLNGINGINGNQRPRQNGINGINGVNGHSHEGEEASQDEHSDEDDKDASGQPMEQLNINGGHEDPDENDGHEQRDTGEAGHHRI